jgi:hypothetical protein
MNLNLTAQVGGIIDLSIKRATGEIDYYGEFHNVMGQTLAVLDRHWPGYSMNFYTQSGSGNYSLSGTWTVANGKVTRASGGTIITSGYPTNGNLLVFGNGEQAYKLSNAVTVSSFDISKPLNIPSPTSITVYKTN